MTFQPGATLYTQGFGSRPENVEVPHLDVRAPGLTDVNYPVGKRWINTVAGTEYVLGNFTTSVGVTTANWAFLGGTSGDLNSLTTQDLTVVTPTAGTILLSGATNQLTTTGSNGPGTATVGLVNAVIAPGSLTTTTTLASGTTLTAGSSLTVTTSATVGTTLGVTGLTTLAALTQVGTTLINASGAAATTIGTGGTGVVNIGNTTGNTAVTGSLTASTSLTATLGAITATNGNLVLVAAGNKMLRTSVGTTTAAGANSIGSVVLTGGSATVSTTSVTTNSLIQIWRQTVGATGAAALGELSVGTITNGTSFVINAWQPANATALQASDVSVIGWEIIN